MVDVLEGGGGTGPTGDPAPPTELQLRDDEIGQALKPWVERLGIACVLKDKMEAVEKALVEAGEEFYGPRSLSP